MPTVIHSRYDPRSALHPWLRPTSLRRNFRYRFFREARLSILISNKSRVEETFDRPDEILFHGEFLCSRSYVRSKPASIISPRLFGVRGRFLRPAESDTRGSPTALRGDVHRVRNLDSADFRNAPLLDILADQYRDSRCLFVTR